MHESITYSSEQMRRFLVTHELPDSFKRIVEDHYSRLVRWVANERVPGRAMVLGINGAQGSGKSTLADFLRAVLSEAMGWQVAVISIDDFYLTREQRLTLANTVHPLFQTRGVPGTHDILMLGRYLNKLGRLADKETLALPRFDKSKDERFNIEQWPVVDGPIDLVILEGWCVGSLPQSDESLSKAVNQLEIEEDPRAVWRRYANTALANDYAGVFSKIHALVFLQAPSLNAVRRWRLKQERKLAIHSAPDARGVLNSSEVKQFVQYFERLTQANLNTMPSIADVVLELGEDHLCAASRYKPGN